MPNALIMPTPWSGEQLGTYLPQARQMYTDLVSGATTTNQRINEGREYLRAAQANDPTVKPVILIVELFSKNTDGSIRVEDRFLGMQVGDRIYSFKDDKYYTRAELTHGELQVAKWYYRQDSAAPDPLLNGLNTFMLPWAGNALRDVMLEMANLRRVPPPQQITPVRIPEPEVGPTTFPSVPAADMREVNLPTVTLRVGDSNYLVQPLKQALNEMQLQGPNGVIVLDTSNSTYDQATADAVRILQEFLRRENFRSNNGQELVANGEFNSATLEAWNQYNNMLAANRTAGSRGTLPSRGGTLGARMQPGFLELNTLMTNTQYREYANQAAQYLLQHPPANPLMPANTYEQLFLEGEASIMSHPPSWNSSYRPMNLAERVYLETMQARADAGHEAIIANRGERGIENGCASYASMLLGYLYPEKNIPRVEGVVSLFDQGVLQNRYTPQEGLQNGLLSDSPTNGGLMFGIGSGHTSRYSNHVVVTVLRDPDHDGLYQWFAYEDYSRIMREPLAVHRYSNDAWYGRYPGT